MTTTAEVIRRHESRAQKAVLAAAGITKANTELAVAMLNAESGSLPSHVVGAIGDAIEILSGAIKEAERFRVKQLRKADMKEHANA